MPTFYFDVYDGQKATYDEFGVELPNLDEATDEAAALLPELAREVIPSQQSNSFGAAVRDENGEILYRAVLLFQGQRTADDDKAYLAALSDARRQSLRNADLKATARVLGDRLMRNVDHLLTVLDSSKAQIEASHKAIIPRGPGGAL
ncbi:hypothetical protein I3A86_24815 [Salmonella enterica]|nr:hypothetical protein [Salmonella enterica]